MAFKAMYRYAYFHDPVLSFSLSIEICFMMFSISRNFHILHHRWSFINNVGEAVITDTEKCGV